MSYNICPECGAALDPGERCDCRLQTRLGEVSEPMEAEALEDPAPQLYAGRCQVQRLIVGDLPMWQAMGPFSWRGERRYTEYEAQCDLLGAMAAFRSALTTEERAAYDTLRRQVLVEEPMAASY